MNVASCTTHYQIYRVDLHFLFSLNMVLGAVNLSKGLRNNSTLKQLHLSFCQLPPEAGLPIAEVTPPFSIRFPLLCFFASVLALYISLPMFLHFYS